MSKCPTCGGEMKPLLQGEFCPNDCDKREQPPDNLDTLDYDEIIAVGAGFIYVKFKNNSWYYMDGKGKVIIISSHKIH